ncbi:MAG: 3-deoxy-7-phosphoheptulonate synthase [Clostridia bacterium]|nr:3-deoxy-7-phosphoheptulonate synthase [Clostridia bacterium]
MIIILRPDCGKPQIKALEDWLHRQGLHTQLTVGDSGIVLGVIGDASGVSAESLLAMDGVRGVHRVQEAHKLASRRARPQPTVVEVGAARIGGGRFCLIAGPCSVESAEQMRSVAESVREAGADMLRGGVFKPRTSPYAFQGLGAEGAELLAQAGRHAALPTVTEITDVSQLETLRQADMLQVGARNMQNFELLKALGRQKKPVLLKRGAGATLQELLMSAEYILSGGNGQVVLCERGIRTHETATRATLDLSAVPVLRELTHLPVIVDPSHAAGASRLVEPLALAAVAAGADGLMIEVHGDPAHALSDGAQALTPEAFARLASKVRALRECLEKTEAER